MLCNRYLYVASVAIMFFWGNFVHASQCNQITNTYYNAYCYYNWRHQTEEGSVYRSYHGLRSISDIPTSIFTPVETRNYGRVTLWAHTTRSSCPTSSYTETRTNCSPVVNFLVTQTNNNYVGTRVITFSNKSTDPNNDVLSSIWRMNGQVVSTQTGHSFYFFGGNPTAVTVQLTVTDPYGLSSTKTQSVTLQPYWNSGCGGACP